MVEDQGFTGLWVQEVLITRWKGGWFMAGQGSDARHSVDGELGAIGEGVLGGGLGTKWADRSHSALVT